MKKTLFLVIALLIGVIAIAQVGINTSSPSTILEIDGNGESADESVSYVSGEGILIPRYDEMPSVNGMDEGEMIYVNGVGFNYYDPEKGWTVVGNTSQFKYVNFNDADPGLTDEHDDAGNAGTDGFNDFYTIQSGDQIVMLRVRNVRLPDPNDHQGRIITLKFSSGGALGHDVNDCTIYVANGGFLRITNANVAGSYTLDNSPGTLNAVTVVAEGNNWRAISALTLP